MPNRWGISEISEIVVTFDTLNIYTRNTWWKALSLTLDSIVANCKSLMIITKSIWLEFYLATDRQKLVQILAEDIFSRSVQYSLISMRYGSKILIKLLLLKQQWIQNLKCICGITNWTLRNKALHMPVMKL